MRFNGRFSYLLVFLYTLQAIPTSFAEKGEVLKNEALNIYKAHLQDLLRIKDK